MYIYAFIFILCAGYAHPKSPNIIFILADDLGWNDVGFHGSNQIPTPNIDALAYTGVILNKYYVAPLCTPSRGALMTAKYPSHLGLQHGVIHAFEPYGLNLSEVILPQILKDAGYSTHAVGKWHLGNFKKEYTPLYRGFQSHYGYWTGHQDYYDHTAQEMRGYWGYDMRRGMNISWNDYGVYTTDLLTREAVKIIKGHDSTKPMFLYMAHLATHSANPYRPLQAPYERIERFQYIEDNKRRIFAAMVSKLDDSVGEIVDALSSQNMLRDSIIIFSTDNGGPAAGFNSNAASNWPLRGVKDTMWEGGVRGAAFIWSLKLKARVNNHLMHITDWLPTLIDATGQKYCERCAKQIDGISQWDALTSPSEASPREELLVNIDTERGVAGYIKNEWKLIQGNTYKGQWNDWFGPGGRDYSYDWKSLYSCPAAKAIQPFIQLPSQEQIQQIRDETGLKCSPPARKPRTEELYLFNLTSDGCEINNLADSQVATKNRFRAARIARQIQKKPSASSQPTPRSTEQS